MKTIFLMSLEMSCSVDPVGQGVELAEVGLHRQPVECWELLLGVDVLLVTLLVYNRPVQSSVLLAECLQRLSSRLLYYAALWARLTTTTGRKRSARTGRLISLLELSYNSYEPENNIGKFPGIPDTGEEEEKRCRRYLRQYKSPTTPQSNFDFSQDTRPPSGHISLNRIFHGQPIILTMKNSGTHSSAQRTLCPTISTYID